jgi:DnaK suppressor protein
VAKHAAKPVAKPATKPTAKPVAKPAPAAVVVKSASPAPASTLFKGKVASATAMVTPRAAPAAAHHASSHKNQKNSSSSMNKLASKKLDNGITREDGRYALPSTSNITLPKGYHPSPNEEYMNPMHLAYFRNKLRDWRDQLVEESRQTMDNLREEVRDVGDEAERATRETENSLELRTRDRYRKLISKIDKALRRIEEGSYGFCEETDEEIGIDRLDARPIATLSLDAQERREHLQKQMGD